MNNRLPVLSLCIRAILLGSLVIMMASCAESESSAYKRGYSDGQKSGAEAVREDTAAVREQGRQAGFKEGFEAARPTAGTTAPAGVWRAVSIIIMILGMVKIVLSLVVFILLLILDSPSRHEKLAKMVATSLGTIVVFWLSNTFTVGFSQPLIDVLLGPAAGTSTSKLLTGLAAALFTWAGLWAIELIVGWSEEHIYVQTVLVFLASAIVSILIPLFFSMHNVPNINGYLFFDLVLGVVIGGILWVVHRLLVASKGTWKGLRVWKKIW